MSLNPIQERLYDNPIDYIYSLSEEEKEFFDDLDISHITYYLFMCPFKDNQKIEYSVIIQFMIWNDLMSDKTLAILEEKYSEDLKISRNTINEVEKNW